MPTGPRVTAEWVGGELSRSVSSRVTLAVDSEGKLMAVRTAVSEGVIKMFGCGLKHLKILNHFLIVKPFLLSREDHSSVIVTEFAGNGSLTDHLSGFENCEFCALQGPTRTVHILWGFAMRFIHSRGVIHGNLTPGTILLDWNWKVLIAGFGHNVLQRRITQFEGFP
jgi:serine/threonine protein kinase